MSKRIHEYVKGDIVKFVSAERFKEINEKFITDNGGKFQNMLITVEDEIDSLAGQEVKIELNILMQGGGISYVFWNSELNGRAMSFYFEDDGKTTYVPTYDERVERFKSINSTWVPKDPEKLAEVIAHNIK